jgi:hypothetical protein
LIEFGRLAAADRKKRGIGRPETFAFLGFTFICGKSRRGAFQLQRKTRRDRMRAKLQEIKAELRQRMHQTIPDQGRWLRQVVTGHFAYYAVPTNSRALSAFRHYVADLWRRTLRRRSQKDGFTWDRMTKLANGWLPRRVSVIPGPISASPSNTRGKSRMLVFTCHLYMPAMSAMRYNPAIVALVARLKSQGRLKPKQIVVAAMRKLLVLCFGVLKTGKSFDPAIAMGC